MSRPIVECVANVSEGRRPEIIRELGQAIASVEGVKLLHVDAGHDAHRTVFTFAGTDRAVLDAAFALFTVAVARIDMREHRGTHPRMGAVDVCPFVPLANADLPHCSRMARTLGERVWRELGVPVYLYEAAASAPHRQNLAAVRRGEYEGLAQKMRESDWRVDYGTTDWNPRTGTAIIGARPFLIAWNINLATQELATAKALAAALRGSGRVVQLASGERSRQAGLFPGLKAIGWELEEFGICQVSTNVVDPERTSLFEVFDQCRTLAEQHYDCRVTGSELIGLIPEKYLRAPGEFPDRAAALDAGVRLLGLDDLQPFNWRERVLEELL